MFRSIRTATGSVSIVDGYCCAVRGVGIVKIKIVAGAVRILGGVTLSRNRVRI